MNDNNLLKYPFSILKTEKPDFVITYNNKTEIGIEITRATDENFEKHMTEIKNGIINLNNFTKHSVKEDWLYYFINAIEKQLGKLNDYYK